ncbi:hypothetical protein CPTD_01040 [Corynebacterium pseudotuberculosis]|nr:hypothetical protein CPTA_00510 [Corynebacterium pseudotuberculosis]AIG09078.1 hypothetical protein CPTB_01022 [Corynebacterium pseudotuberculosis]AIG10977.1 hypothetical protein CPTC_00689 [Corynebacterium pseudotuberculosis]ATQ66439.1 Hypothetical protein CpPA07_2160 [Corynebacterium pseudotuberculosis]KEX89302.1 hypothetical protein CPTD_01040 [Corynebacterium pseudotuberculosis]
MILGQVFNPRKHSVEMSPLKQLLSYNKNNTDRPGRSL